jgi:hypothetical protein
MACLAAVLSCVNPAFAQQSISSEKKALIGEIRELTGMKNLAAKTEMTKTNIGNAVLSVLDKDKELTDTQKQELKKFAIEGKDRLEKQIRDFSADKTISSQLFDEAFIQLYDKNFNDRELQEMAAFYRTPTGQKATKFMAGFINQLTKTFSESFGKKVQEFGSSKLEEEIELLKQKIKEMKDRKKLEG